MLPVVFLEVVLELVYFLELSVAGKMVYTYLGEEEIVKVQEIMTIDDNKAYHVTYTAPVLEFDDLLPTVQKMINSVKVLPMLPCKFEEDKESAFGGKCVL